MRKAHRSFRATEQKHLKVVPLARPTVHVAPHAHRRCSGRARERLGTVPGMLLGDSRSLLARPGRPKIQSRLALARPGAVPNTSRRIPETVLSAQNRLRAIFRRFFIDLARFCIDFRSIFHRILQDVGTNLALNPLLSSTPFSRCCVGQAFRNG